VYTSTRRRLPSRQYTPVVAREKEGALLSDSNKPEADHAEVLQFPAQLMLTFTITNSALQVTIHFELGAISVLFTAHQNEYVNIIKKLFQLTRVRITEL
jgi:hypothetical protein